MAFTLVSSRVSVPTRAVRATPARAFGTSSVPVVRGSRNASVVVRAEPTSVERALKDAEEACQEGDAAECAAAWDVVEELSAAASHKKDAENATSKDPLDAYCEKVPDADECRVYEE